MLESPRGRSAHFQRDYIVMLAHPQNRDGLHFRLVALIFVMLMLALALFSAPLEARDVDENSEPTARPTPTRQAAEVDDGYDLMPDKPARSVPVAAAAPAPQNLSPLPPVAPEELANVALAPHLVWRASTATRKIAITFDTGKGAPIVQIILNELREANVRATFFLVGNWIEKNADVVRAIAADGHDLANHSYSHPNFDNLSDDQILAQLVVTENLVRSVTGCTTRPFFRPPFGSMNHHALEMIAKAGFQSIMWSAHGGDWLPGATMESVRERVVANTGNGTIVVLHSSVPQTAQALPHIINDLRTRGYELVTLSELLTPNSAQPVRAACGK